MTKSTAARDGEVPNTASPRASFKAPIAEKLAELRAKIVEIEARKSFTPKQRRMVFEAQNGRCAVCDEALGKPFEIDHVISRGIGGKHEPGNWLGKCIPCHAAKTKVDRKVQAKADRIIKRETEGQKSSRLQSPGFKGWRRFDGGIVWRKS